MRKLCSSFFIILVLLLLQSCLINGQISSHDHVRRDDYDALLPTLITATKTIVRNKDEPTSESHRTDNDDDYKKKKTPVTTEINIIYTTIIYSPLPTIYNVSNTGSPGYQNQQQQQTTPGVSDPNSKKDSDKTLQDSLNQDQQALKRMIMILSLVGGLGVIAIVATIVIFTRMRARNRKQREIDEEGNEGSTFELSADTNNRPTMDSRSDNSSSHGNHSGSHGNGSNGTPPLHPSSSSSSISSHDRPLIEPSAPPALMMMTENQLGTHDSRRTVLSLSTQTTAPSPSAPTAKELDAMVDQGQLDDVTAAAATSSSAAASVSNHHHHHQPSTNCSRCTPILMAPELPPPAYTPSAPPHYALPVEAIVMESPSSSASSPVLPSRRHSLGG